MPIRTRYVNIQFVPKNSIAHPPAKRKAFFVNKRACRAKGARRAARFAVLSTESGSFRAPAAQDPTSNKKPPLPETGLGRQKILTRYHPSCGEFLRLSFRQITAASRRG